MKERRNTGISRRFVTGKALLAVNGVLGPLKRWLQRLPDDRSPPTHRPKAPGAPPSVVASELFGPASTIFSAAGITAPGIAFLAAGALSPIAYASAGPLRIYLMARLFADL
jgi:hypothetical protein